MIKMLIFKNKLLKKQTYLNFLEYAQGKWNKSCALASDKHLIATFSHHYWCKDDQCKQE